MPKRIYEILGQEAPLAATETVLYTVPSKRTAIVKVTCFDSNGADIKVAIVPDGGKSFPPATSSENYLVDGFPLGTTYIESYKEFKGITMNEFDEIRVESDKATTKFHVYGVEIEP